MKTIFLPFLTLLLSLAIFQGNAARGADPKQPAKAQEDEGVDPNSFFTLANRNGLEMHVIETTLPELGKDVTNTYFVATFKDKEKTQKWVMEHPEAATGIQLIVAAYAAYQAGDLEEATFLYHAGRLRLYHDLKKYEPKNTESGTPSTDWFLSLLVDAVKVDVLNRICVEPAAFAAVVKRLETLDMKEPAGYDPGWDYTLHDVSPDMMAKNKAELLESLKPLSQVLQIPEYFAAFREVRACTELPLDQQKTPAVVERRAKAMETMTRIEKEKNLHGMVYQVNQVTTD